MNLLYMKFIEIVNDRNFIGKFSSEPLIRGNGFSKSAPPPPPNVYEHAWTVSGVSVLNPYLSVRAATLLIFLLICPVTCT